MQSIQRYCFPKNRFYALWCWQRPPASVGVKNFVCASSYVLLNGSFLTMTWDNPKTTTTSCRISLKILIKNSYWSFAVVDKFAWYSKLSFTIFILNFIRHLCLYVYLKNCFSKTFYHFLWKLRSKVDYCAHLLSFSRSFALNYTSIKN